MKALIKDKDNYTKEKTIQSGLRIVANKRKWGIISGFRTLFSIQDADNMFVSSKNFARKTWATHERALRALVKIYVEDESIFLCEPRLEIWQERQENERKICSLYREEYGYPVTTYYVL